MRLAIQCSQCRPRIPPVQRTVRSIMAWKNSSATCVTTSTGRTTSCSRACFAATLQVSIAASNSSRGNNCKSCEKILHTQLMGGRLRFLRLVLLREPNPCSRTNLDKPGTSPPPTISELSCVPRGVLPARPFRSDARSRARLYRLPSAPVLPGCATSARAGPGKS